MGFFDSVFGWGGEDPEAVRQRQQAAYNAEIRRLQDEFYAQEAFKEKERLRLIDEANAAASGQARGTNVAPATATGPATLPAGFELGYTPESLTDPFEEQAFGRERQKAQDVIDRMFRRGTVTETGRRGAMDIVGGQEAGVRGRLNDVGNVLLENERARLRGIGRTEADLPAVTSSSAAFQAGLPAAYEAALPEGDLFSVANLSSQVGGGVSGTQAAPPLDPYAVEGGQLKTGLEEPTGRPASKKRTTAVF